MYPYIYMTIYLYYYINYMTIYVYDLTISTLLLAFKINLFSGC